MALYRDEELESASRLFKALSSTTRLRILVMVMGTKRPLHIKAISRQLGIDYAATYRHVEAMKKAGLVEIYEVGRSRVLSPLKIEVIRQLMDSARLYG